MKKTILNQIQEIKTDPNLNARQKWTAILAIETFGKRGAAEARKIQDDIKSKWMNIRYRVRHKSREIWVSSAQKKENFDYRCMKNQHQNELLMADAANGYPQTLLIGSTCISLSLVNIEDLVGGTNRQYAKIDDWIISSVESVTWENNFYSKSYGYGKKTVDSRTVLIRRMRNGKVEKHDVQVDSWRGSWALKAFNSVSKIKAEKESIVLKELIELDAQNDFTCDEEVCVAL